MAIHVDDRIIMGEDERQIEEMLLKLENQFQITKTTNPKVYLRIQSERQPDGIHISQTNYARQMLEKYNMQESQEMKTPMATTPPTNDEGENDIRFLYTEAVGSLLYMSSKTRPDMAFAVNVESRTLENPDKVAVQNAKRTLRYVKGTRDSGIKYTSSDSETVKLEAFSDADYAGDVKDRKSVTGYVIMMSGGPISWCSRKQSIVALSTTEAEYISAAECCKELKYLKTLIEELTGKRVEAELCVDNQSAIKLIESGQVTRRSKHTDVRYHYISEQLKIL
ncbi:hypothetical protein B7P43_G06356 [Cryptotermes secundus]|uniref:Reverse transcriptase Ty1/copia-type domain-containing protein n=1 Tax=Cryptotermes secundus TaxID=105785 RepID=A0A2J7QBT4_9NEOP|nr:hypothetical protein B7P43_G06356 [Cryptotermes secundus]